MSESYSPVLWNKQKKRYDQIMVGLIAFYLILFVGLQLAFRPNISPETLIIRTTGTLAFLMLHIILCIGPLSRISPKFLPLLYNRRHLGVTMFLFALIHGIFNIIQFHALGDTDPLLSIFIANDQYTSFVNFPFQVLGFFALIILFLMAATSHDFWLKNLSPKVWKGLHMMVYLAYALILFHVMLGVIQLESSPIWLAVFGLGMLVVIIFHLLASGLTIRQTTQIKPQAKDEFVYVCQVDEIAEDRAKTLAINGENIAVFKYNGKIAAVNNVCRHQQGPLGEGKILDGCITCPWHGYQYLPENGQSPPPFTEKIETYDTKVVDGKVMVNPKPHAPGTKRPVSNIS